MLRARDLHRILRPSRFRRCETSNDGSLLITFAVATLDVQRRFPLSGAGRTRVRIHANKVQPPTVGVKPFPTSVSFASLCVRAVITSFYLMNCFFFFHRNLFGMHLLVPALRSGAYHGTHGYGHPTGPVRDHVQPETARPSRGQDFLQQMEPALLGERRGWTRGDGQK